MKPYSLKLHSTGREKQAPPPPRWSVRLAWRKGKTVAEQIAEVPLDRFAVFAEKTGKTPEQIKDLLTRYAEANQDNPRKRWNWWGDAWFEFINEGPGALAS